MSDEKVKKDKKVTVVPDSKPNRGKVSHLPSPSQPIGALSPIKSDNVEKVTFKESILTWRTACTILLEVWKFPPFIMSPTDMFLFRKEKMLFLKIWQ